MQTCGDCADVKRELAALKQTIVQWFELLLPKIDLVGEQVCATR